MISGSVLGSLGDLIQERLARFGVVGADVLRWAAVLSPRIDVGKLIKVSGLDARAMVCAGRLCLRFFANDDALSLARKGLQLAETLSDAGRADVVRAEHRTVDP